MEATFSTGFGSGLIVGILFGLIILEQFYRSGYKKMVDEIADQYKSILDYFGIKKNNKGNWELTDKDMNRVWIKK
jgi:hypothetical protein